MRQQEPIAPIRETLNVYISANQQLKLRENMSEQTQLNTRTYSNPHPSFGADRGGAAISPSAPENLSDTPPQAFPPAE
jgi:hypothetical protein